MIPDETVAFWKRHYEALAADGPRWLDYSNDRTQAQSFALALDAAGPLDGRDVLDVGCGHGQLSLAARALGAHNVTGSDLTESGIRRNAQAYPELQWVAGSASSLRLDRTFDVVFAIEVLQYVPLSDTIPCLWKLVRNGGRLVIIVPNRDCPIVGRAVARFEGRFAPPSAADLREALERLPDLAWWRMRGMHFGTDQVVTPYEATPWTQAPAWQAQPNRLQVVTGKT